MSGLLWHPRLSCGDDVIDTMHRDILSTSFALSCAAEENTHAFSHYLLKLQGQIHDHFVEEERLLARVLDPVQVTVHSQDHANLLKLLSDASASLVGHGGDRHPKLALVRLVRNWLIKEIADNDGHAFMLARRAGAVR